MKITTDHFKSGLDASESLSSQPNPKAQPPIHLPGEPWKTGAPDTSSVYHDLSKHATDGTHRVGKREDAPPDMEVDDEKVISKEMFDGWIASKKGTLTPLSAHPEFQERIKACLDEAITTVRVALSQTDRHWNPKTLSKMKELMGDDAKSSDVRNDLRKKLENALSILENMRSRQSKDIFIDSDDKSSLAYVVRLKSGYSGQTVFTQHGLEVVDNKRVVKTLIHEASHIANNSNDNWYVKLDDDGNFNRKPPSGDSGFLHPLRSNYALNNADSVAHAAVVLADNSHSYHDELGV